MLAYYFHEKCNFGLQTTTTKPKFFQLGWLLFFLTLIFAQVQGRVSITYQLGIEFIYKKILFIKNLISTLPRLGIEFSKFLITYLD